MKRYKIETDGQYYYPYARKGVKWEPIENYYVSNGLIYSTGSNQCSTIDRARFLVSIVRRKSVKPKRKVIWQA